MVETIESEQATPSLSQAQRMKKKSQAGELNEDTVLSIMSEEYLAGKHLDFTAVVLPQQRGDLLCEVRAAVHHGQQDSHVGHKSREAISDSDSGRTVQRYVRLTES